MHVLIKQLIVVLEKHKLNSQKREGRGSQAPCTTIYYSIGPVYIASSPGTPDFSILRAGTPNFSMLHTCLGMRLPSTHIEQAKEVLNHEEFYKFEV